MADCKGKVIVVLSNNLGMSKDIKKILNREGFIVFHVKNITSAEELCSEYSPDLLLIISPLNINQYFMFCRKLKFFKPACKIVLSCEINTSNILMDCFQNGIDDYIHNSINQYELIARIKKNLSLLEYSQFLEYHGIKLCITSQYITINNICIYLSKNETKVIKQMISNSGTASLNSLCNTLSSNNTATRMCILRLKKKFKKNTGMEIIKSRYGVGYYIAI